MTRDELIAILSAPLKNADIAERLFQQIAQMQSDLADARSGWESASEAARELDGELRVARERIAELERMQGVLVGRLI